MNIKYKQFCLVQGQNDIISLSCRFSSCSL